MVLELEIREWQQKKLNDYCKVCQDSCCNSKKHKIIFDSVSLLLFEEHGIPIIKNNQLKNHFLIKNEIHLADGSIVKKPSIIQLPGLIFRTKYDEWYIYSDFCPFYTKGEGCKVHENPRRPEVCKEYPLAFFGCNDSQGKFLDVKIMKSCEYFNRSDVKSEFKKKFPVRFIN